MEATSKEDDDQNIRHMKRLGVINALRGLSALAIVLYHVRLPLWVGWTEISAHPEKYSLIDQALAYPGAGCHFFGQAVMLFFVLSGFCIHYPYAGQARLLELKSYAIRRVLRIYPPYFAAVALSLVATYASYHYWGLRDPSSEHFLRSFLMTQNYPPNAGQIDINPALWSLPVEMELYLAYPIFYLCLVRFGLSISIGFALAITLAGQILRLYSGDEFPYIDWHNFTLYWLTWCGGAWLAEKLATNSLPKCGLGWTSAMLIAFGLAICGDSKVFNWFEYEPGRRLIWGGFFFLLVAWCLQRSPYTEDSSSWTGKALNGLGSISYSLYLTHYPLLIICGHLIVGPRLDLAEGKPSNFLVSLGFTAFAIVFATIFYALIERPCHRWARRLGRST